MHPENVAPPVRVRRLRTPGWRLPAGAIYVGRPTQFGNPFTIEAARDFHREHGQPANGERPAATAVRWYREWLAEPARAAFRETIVAELRGHALACWCNLKDPCHAGVLLEIANA